MGTKMKTFFRLNSEDVGSALAHMEGILKSYLRQNPSVMFLPSIILSLEYDSYSESFKKQLEEKKQNDDSKQKMLDNLYAHRKIKEVKHSEEVATNISENVYPTKQIKSRTIKKLKVVTQSKEGLQKVKEKMRAGRQPFDTIIDEVISNEKLHREVSSELDMLVKPIEVKIEESREISYSHLEKDTTRVEILHNITKSGDICPICDTNLNLTAIQAQAIKNLKDLHPLALKQLCDEIEEKSKKYEG